MQKKTYNMTVYGCQMNERDAETLRGFLDVLGYEEVSAADTADLVIMNTCAVRKKAEEKVFSRIGRLAGFKEKNRDMIIAVCGCMVQQEETANRIRSNYPFVDLVFGTHNIASFPELLARADKSSTPVFDLQSDAGEVREGLPVIRRDSVRAWVNITYGCNNYCSYCIVPYVRGRERSRKPEDILSEIKGLAESGYKEVTLLGQNVNSYGKDLDRPLDFSDLLALADRETGIRRIRFMTSHPRDFTEKLTETMAHSKNICRHVHLPVQSGSNRILKLMNRGYTREHYLSLAEMLKGNVTGCTLTTDLIVGFPSETDEDFADTLDLVDSVGFDSAYTFLYSRRPGTPAAAMAEQVPDVIKKERLQILTQIQNKWSLHHNEKLVGKITEVLVEGPGKTGADILTGRTRGAKIVNFAAEGKKAGDLAMVEITAARTWSLAGRLSVADRNPYDSSVQRDQRKE